MVMPELLHHRSRSCARQRGELPNPRVFLSVLFAAALTTVAEPSEPEGPRPTDKGSVTRSTAESDIAVAEPKGTNRVTATAVFHPQMAAPGETTALLVKLRIAPGHWIYALNDSGSRTLVPTTVMTASEKPFRLVEAWRSSEPKVKSDGSRVYSGEVVFKSRFRIDSSAADRLQKLPITVRYQVCNEALCWPPATISLEPGLKINR